MGNLASILSEPAFEFGQLFAALLDVGCSVLDLARLALTCRVARAWCRNQLQQCNQEHIWRLLLALPSTTECDARHGITTGRVTHRVECAPLVWYSWPEGDAITHALVVLMVLDMKEPRLTTSPILWKTGKHPTPRPFGPHLDEITAARFSIFDLDVRHALRERHPPEIPDLDELAALRVNKRPRL